ncbi:MAG: hypothetical protein USCGTAYLOR_01818 [Chromatiales bacterium USCg_Taylor]|nr:MAG: hypothetical protein USCGTAYLOR_01818 [Chromatiales bacterium USCg_Taylor]
MSYLSVPSIGLPLANALRGTARHAKFREVVHADGGTYKHVSPHNSVEFITRLEAAEGCRVAPTFAFFRLDLDNELPHNPVHVDFAQADKLAIVYLWRGKAQPKSGTAERCSGMPWPPGAHNVTPPVTCAARYRPRSNAITPPSRNPSA